MGVRGLTNGAAPEISLAQPQLQGQNVVSQAKKLQNRYFEIE